MDRKILVADATVENIGKVTAFVDEYLKRWGCPARAQTQIDIAIDELFGNIAQYAYHPQSGTAIVQVEVTENPLAAIVTFIDHGMPFDPLASADPDTTLMAEERQVGGLGIYLVRQSMDEVCYEYRDGKNILRIKKEF